ncbi:MAG: hypothetical protein KGH78_02100 [Candidatus Micrarchaeota archaeon]|nr:hypothetical protein [Candidatus Micrarchaeota archaeon]MDE1847272.1 hypothetical protein [Candidatus Micrarchaeota archaeon]
MELKPLARQAIQNGSIKIRVKRSGMYQQLTFHARKALMGNVEFIELFTDRIVDTSELLKVAEDFGLPIEAPNAKVFPKGTSAQDFSSLVGIAKTE